MTIPARAKTWTITPNNRIAFASLLVTMESYLKGVADFLLAHGYTCKGSCNGTTGAMDGVNRWTTLGAVGVRAANTTSPVSWMVLTDGNGCNICLSYVGATDDVARIAYSPSGVYVVAGTPSNTPTALDEQVLMTGVTLIGATTSLDRLWYGWVDSTSKLCRFIVMRDTALVGVAWGVELITSKVTISFSPAVWGFAYTAASFTPTGFNNTFSANLRGGRTRINGTSVDLLGGFEAFFGAPTTFQALKPELVAAIGYPMGPCSIGSTIATRQGPVGDLFDWYTGPGAVLNGNVFFGGTWIAIGVSTNGSPGASLVWPWDGVTEPQTN